MDMSSLARAGASGLLGGIFGWPMDTAVNLGNLARAAYGYGGHELGLLGTDDLPATIDPRGVPGTSEYLAGLLGVGVSGPEQVAQFVGGLLSPSPGGKVRAAGGARKRATLPADDASRLARAKSQGYDVDWWRGDAAAYDVIDPKKYGSTTGTHAAKLAYFATRSADDARAFAKNANVGGGRVMQAAIAPQRPAHFDWPDNYPPVRSENGQRMLASVIQDAKDAGYDALMLRGAKDATSDGRSVEIIAVLDPAIVRDAGRARFDPAKKGLSGLTLGAGGVGLAGLLGYQGDQEP